MCTGVDLFINFNNLPCFINDNSHPLDFAIGRVRRAVQKREITVGIYQQWEVQLVFFRKFLTRIRVIVGNPENLGIMFR